MRKSCLFCKSNKVNDIIDLGSHPFADTFIPKNSLYGNDHLTRLVCQLCSECGNIQLKYPTSPDERYNLYDYSYTSSNSLYSKKHWESYCHYCIEKFDLKSQSKVLEIGSNDGYLLNQFKKKRHIIQGVDASKTLSKLANKKGVSTLGELFTKNTAKKLKKKFNFFDLIIANNVFNHLDNPIAFLESISTLMKKDSIFIFEQPYWLNSVIDYKYDQIYHEHVTYILLKPIKKLLESKGMFVRNFEINEYHGGSIRIICQKNNFKNLYEKKIRKQILKEKNTSLYSLNFYKKFQIKINNEKNNFLYNILKLKKKGHKIVGIGAAAKANTFLNFHKIDNSLFDYITDTSKFKIGKLTPYSRIPIVNDNHLKTANENYYIYVLAWNLQNILRKKLEKINKKLNFLTYK